MKRITRVVCTRESLQMVTAADRWNGFSRGILVHFSRHSNELRHSKGRSTAAGKSCAAQHLPGEIHPRLMVPPVPWVLDMSEKHLDDINKSVAKLICASPTELKGLEDLHIQKKTWTLTGRLDVAKFPWQVVYSCPSPNLELWERIRSTCISALLKGLRNGNGGFHKWGYP